MADGAQDVLITRAGDTPALFFLSVMAILFFKSFFKLVFRIFLYG